MTRGVRVPDIACCNPKCGKVFHPGRVAGKYCSSACSVAARELHLSDEDRTKLMRLHKAGLKYKDIGEELGVSKYTVARLARKEGLTGHPGRPSRPSRTWNPEANARLSELLRSGMGYRDVAKAMGKSYGSVYSRSLRMDQTMIHPPLCCPVCDHQMNVLSRKRYSPWTPGQEKLLLKLASLKVPQEVIGSVFNTGAAGVQIKLAQMRSRRK